MRDATATLLLTRIHRGAVQLILQPNTRDLWRLPHVDVRNADRAQTQLLEWIAVATPFTQLAKLAELNDPLTPDRATHLVQIHDALTSSIANPFFWFDIQDLPPLAFLNEQRLFQERTRHITEIIIAHQNPYRLIPGFR